MVFHCRCFTLSFIENEKVDDESRTQTNSTWTRTFYTAFSHFSRSRPNIHANTPQISSNLRVFTLAELKVATKNFSKYSKIGEGGFGSVYRGVINSNHPYDEIQVAVKLGKEALQGHKQWVTEINVLGAVEHPNLVKLVGYCTEDIKTGTQLLLVYEYMPKRSVRDQLSKKSRRPLSWTMRLKVAQDAARGLTYLHEEMDFQIIFRDFKSSNILIDDQWNAKLSDFGLARLGPKEGDTHVTTNYTGTMGYSAPEYLETGRLTSKCDVWSYGVFLNELITGRHPLEKGLQDLYPIKMVPYLNTNKLLAIIDSRLEGNCSLESVRKLSCIANLCLCDDRNSRPKMSEVLRMVNKLVENQSAANDVNVTTS